MQVGVVGLGKMGSAIAERLRRGGHEVIGFDRDPSLSSVASLAELVSGLAQPRTIWVMVPSGAPTDETMDALFDLVGSDDTVVDGGNTNFEDSVRRGTTFAERGAHFIDCGTSGGIWGLDEGFCLMLGGSADAVARLTPVLQTLAVEDGFAHVGPNGAGHFVKMVHNAIEYGMLQAYAEGFAMLEGTTAFADLDVGQITRVWRHGSVVRSWLLDLAVLALEADPNLEKVRGYVEDSGEGRWMLHHAIDQALPAPVAAAALFARFSSRAENPYAMRMIAALRGQFGGHVVHEP